ALSRATVYHLLGRVSPCPEYVVWEEDVLEFVCALHQHLPVMVKLARDLKEHALLVIGLNFSDWLVRFFLRITRQSRLSESRTNTEVLAVERAAAGSESMVLFFGAESRNIHVIECDPSEFVLELNRRWREKHPVMEGERSEFLPPPESEMPAGAIFMSYAREDEEAARRLKAGLERHGCLVWYDRERLKPGGNWHNNLEDEVKGRCSLFLSVISRTTEGAPAGYFHQERNWAAELQEIFERVLHKPLTILFGQSGLGKTSLIEAGLIPNLREAGLLPVSIRVRYDEDAPLVGRQMIAALSDALTSTGREDLSAICLGASSLWLLLHDPDCGLIGEDSL